MKAVILAAGMGTRLGTLMPKPLTSLKDEKTIMDYQVEKLSEAVGADNIVVVVGYKKGLIMERFPHLTYVYNPAYTHTNTAKSLLCALRKLDDDVIWMNGDVFFEVEALHHLMQSEKSGILVDTKKCGDEEIKYTLNDDGHIIELAKKLEEGNGEGEAVGINLIKQADLQKFCEALTQVENQDYFEKALENLARAKEITLKPVHIQSAFCQEIDFPEDLQNVRQYIAASI